VLALLAAPLGVFVSLEHEEAARRLGGPGGILD
jgi:hypothetical protein